MDCMLCGGNMEIVSDSFVFASKAIGLVSIPDIDFEFCSQCGEKLVSGSEGQKILNFVRKKESETLKSLPIRDFITAAQAARILGVTEQAFSKNKKIKRGLIFNILIGTRKLYLKESVELFKECDNGIYMLRHGREYKKEVTTKARKSFVTEIEVYAMHRVGTQTDLHGHDYTDPIETDNFITIH